MKSLLEKQDLDSILDRLDRLQADSPRQWGTMMNPNHMLVHCASVMEMASGRINPPQSWLGKIIGQLVKGIFTNNMNLKRNVPTIDEFRQNTTDNGHDFEEARARLRQEILDFHNKGRSGITPALHPFFGKLKPEEWADGMYKHLDHHFRQFGV